MDALGNLLKWYNDTIANAMTVAKSVCISIEESLLEIASLDRDKDCEKD